MQIKIRKATKKDFNTICKFVNKLDDFETTLTPILSNSKARRLEVRNGVAEKLASSKSKYFLAEVDGSIVGAGCATIVEPTKAKFTLRKVGLLEKLFVSEDYRGKGIATKLIEARMTWLRKQGVEWFESNICANNTVSLKASEKAGFKPYSIIMHKYEF
ncbi:MAG TPA: GNAT family N-acetyltransferase [Nanoarchaeota archaeon]|nr:GNAT family N-acetyltransferase [Nanoarchaeota archaeon]